MEKSNNVTNHPSYYNQYPIEVIDMMERIFGREKTRDWCIMTAFKYRMRLGHKDDYEQDFNKEQWYLNKAAELSSIPLNEGKAQAKLKAIQEAIDNCATSFGLFETIKDILSI